jgi:two-component system NtrC family response regulator
MGKILIIDDDEMMCERFSVLIESIGHAATCAITLGQGLEKASTEDFDIVLLDVHLPDGNGLDAVEKIRETPSEPEVIIVTAFGDPDGAEFAIRSGAWDYIEKAPTEKEMILPLKRVLQYRKEKLSKKPPVVLKTEGIVGSSLKIRACLNILAQASISDANFCITGETGTGKEIFARATHDNSPRTQNNFVVVDCTALPETLIESVLFGHEKGAFTGADKSRGGLIEQANGGTLFLDEVGELPLSTQKTFLRVLQDHKFRRVGGKEERKSNFRLIAATNRNLDEMTNTGAFRQDLLFRLRSLTMDIPPLRERSEDIKELVKYHADKLCDRYRMDPKGYSPDFFEALTSYNWPGNVRELVNALDAAIAVAGHDPKLFSKHLPTNMRIQMARDSIAKESSDDCSLNQNLYSNSSLPKLREFRQALEKQYLQDLISLTRRDIKKACQISGISRSRLYELLSKHHIVLSPLSNVSP